MKQINKLGTLLLIVISHYLRNLGMCGLALGCHLPSHYFSPLFCNCGQQTAFSSTIPNLPITKEMLDILLLNFMNADIRSREKSPKFPREGPSSPLP